MSQLNLTARIPSSSQLVEAGHRHTLLRLFQPPGLSVRLKGGPSTCRVGNCSCQSWQVVVYLGHRRATLSDEFLV